MNLSCVFDPAACASGVVSSWVTWFPFGAEGMIFTAGMVVGAALGRWGVGAVIAALLAMKFAAKPVKTDDMFPHPDPRPERAPRAAKPKRKTIFDSFK